MCLVMCILVQISRTGSVLVADEVTIRGSWKGWPDPESLKAPGRPKTSRGRLQAEPSPLPDDLSPSSRAATCNEALAVISPESHSGKATPSHSLTFRPGSLPTSKGADALPVARAEPTDGPVKHHRADPPPGKETFSQASQTPDADTPRQVASLAELLSSAAGSVSPTSRRSLDQARGRMSPGARKPSASGSKTEIVHRSAWKPAGPRFSANSPKDSKCLPETQAVPVASASRRKGSSGRTEVPEDNAKHVASGPSIPQQQPHMNDLNDTPASNLAVSQEGQQIRRQSRGMDESDKAGAKAAQDKTSRQGTQLSVIRQSAGGMSSSEAYDKQPPAHHQQQKQRITQLSGDQLRPDGPSAQKATHNAPGHTAASQSSGPRNAVPPPASPDRALNAMPEQHSESSSLTIRRDPIPESLSISTSAEVDAQPSYKPASLGSNVPEAQIAPAPAGAGSEGRASSPKAASSNKPLPSYGSESFDVLMTALRADAASEGRRISLVATSSQDSQNGIERADVQSRSLAVSRTGSAAWPSRSSPLLDNSRESSRVYSKSQSSKEVNKRLAYT